MHFHTLNDKIKPFYAHLEVPVLATKWPAISPGHPRRASVNSFGFGGANAHAILESYEKEIPLSETGFVDSVAPPVSPFVFSAKSKTALLSLISSYSDFLKTGLSISLHDLSSTLHSRRSVHPIKVVFSAREIHSLLRKLNSQVEFIHNSPNYSIGTACTKIPLILGIFTGQGAQWVAMGRELITSSEFARSRISALDGYLASLPMEDQPAWSIEDELLKNAESSRLGEAEMAQPLCTAVQLLLVDILYATGIEFKCVVGHSSGEIAASYAAGFISGKDAILIAYYRGIYASTGQNDNGQAGAMLAVSTSIDDASELCGLPYFRGRMTVAANNSYNSVTLSGDKDRIAQAVLVFKDEKKPSSVLKVDKAYHSHHMAACAQPYLEALKRSGVVNNHHRNTDKRAIWYSTVTNKKMCLSDTTLRGEYWAKNLTQPVLFKDALENVCSEYSLDLVLEIGPHPALKAPVSQVIESLGSPPIPYVGLLRRGINDIDAVAEGMGTLWSYFPERINLLRYQSLMSGRSTFKVLKNLPRYCWDHDREYWQESWPSQDLRFRERVHSLLGHLTPDSNEGLYCWRNIIKINEIKWLQDHKLQGESVFPAAGYIVLAIEAAIKLAGHRDIQLIEIGNVKIEQALTFGDTDTGTEGLFRVFDISRETNSLIATFMYHCASGRGKQHMSRFASGTLEILFGTSDLPGLPGRLTPETNLISIETSQFYQSILKVGYEYSGSFKALSLLKRRLGWATGHLSELTEIGDASDKLFVHPGKLDAAIHSLLLAYCHPDDGRLWTLHVPTSIQRVTLDMSLLSKTIFQSRGFSFDTTLTESDKKGIFGDVNIYSGEHTVIQMEGIRCDPFAKATQKDDVLLFSREVWNTATPDLSLASRDRHATSKDYELAETVERISYFYIRKLQQEIPLNHPARIAGPYKQYLDFMADIASNAPSVRHPYVKKEWEGDKLNDIISLIEK